MELDPTVTSPPEAQISIADTTETPSVSVTVTYNVPKDASEKTLTELIARLNNNLDELLVQKKNLKGIRRDIRGGPATSRSVHVAASLRDAGIWNPFRAQYENPNHPSQQRTTPGFHPRKRSKPS